MDRHRKERERNTATVGVEEHMFETMLKESILPSSGPKHIHVAQTKTHITCDDFGIGGASCATLAINLNVPSLQAKSPMLTKAKIAVHSAMQRRNTLPHGFTLRGKRQTRSVSRDGAGTSSIAGTTNTNPSAPLQPKVSPPHELIRAKVGNIAGYSPRLCLLENDGNAEISNEDARQDMNVITNEESPSSMQRDLTVLGASVEPQGLFLTAHRGPTAAAKSTAKFRCHERPFCSFEDMRALLCNQEVAFSGVDHAENVGNPTTTTTPAAIATRRPLPASKACHSCRQPHRRLCGRLWTGTTVHPTLQATAWRNQPNGSNKAPSSSTYRKTLFLVSGQGQELLGGSHHQHQRRKNLTSKPTVGESLLSSTHGRNGSGKDRSHVNFHNRVSSTAAAAAGASPPSSTVAATTREARRTTTATPAKIVDVDPLLSASKVHTPCWDWDLGDENSQLSREPNGPTEGEDTDIFVCNFSAESTAGKGGDGGGGRRGRAILRVRVPHPPPTSLLVLKIAPTMPPPKELP